MGTTNVHNIIKYKIITHSVYKQVTGSAYTQGKGSHWGMRTTQLFCLTQTFTLALGC